MSEKKRLFLIDGMANIFRSYYAVRGLSTSRGVATNAVFGFAMMLRKLLTNHKPDYIGVVLDSKEKTFRHDQYEHYKANRTEMPEDLVPQLAYIDRVCAAYRVPIIKMPGFEADDLMGTLAHQAADAGLQAVIVSSDKDLCQLVRDPDIIILREDKTGETWFDEAGVKARLGVRPDQVVDWLGLMGDSSDNIPGAPGIGEKGAIGLIEQFGSIEGALAGWEEVKKKTYRESLRDNVDLIRMSRELARIETNAPVTLDLASLITEEPNREAAYQLFTELEFNQLAREFADVAKPLQAEATAPTTKQYRHVKLVDELKKLSNSLLAKDRFAFAFAVGSVKKEAAENLLDLIAEDNAPHLVGIAISTAAGAADYIDLAVMDDRAAALALLRDLLDNGLLEKAVHGLKQALATAANAGLSLEAVADDTELEAYLLEPERAQYDLPQLAREYLGAEITLPEEVAERALLMADVTGQLANIFAAKIDEAGLRKVYDEIELPLVPLLLRMEQAGFRVDPNALSDLAVEMQKEIERLTQHIYELAGKPFNINSPQQLGEIFEGLNFEVSKRTKTGQIQTNREVLEELAEKYELPRKIIEYREVTKLKSTYVDALPSLISPRDGRVHTTLNQTVAATGRLSSENPNLQNIPIRSELGQRIRRAFVPADGCVLLSADYSQIELRLLAHITEDEEMLDAFLHGEDIHSRTARKVFGAQSDAELKEKRRVAKIVNFAIAYAVGAFGLAPRVGITRTEAKKVIEDYYHTYKGVRRYMEETPDKVRAANGVVRSLVGRWRKLPDISNKNHNLRARAEREAINMPMQGCLPWNTKVLTSDGYRKIGELYQVGSSGLQVWTGSRFAPFQVLNRGRCELAELHLTNGMILKCDMRHQVLIVTEEGYDWKHYSKLQPGDRVCLNLAQPIEFGVAPRFNYAWIPAVGKGQSLAIEEPGENFYYWLGYYFGDGWIHHDPENGRARLSYALGVSKYEEREQITERATACTAYFESLGLRTNFRWQGQQKAELSIYSKGLINFLAEAGVNTRATAATKRVPEFMFQCPLALRKAFLRGLLDSDGYAGGGGATNPSLHLCQRELLADVMLLFRTIGVECKLRGPYNYQNGRLSYRLDLIGGMVGQALGYSDHRIVHTPGMAVPSFLVAAFLAEIPAAKFSSHSHRVLYSRLKSGGSTSVYTMAEMVRQAGQSLSVPIYAWTTLRKKRSLGVIEETFTLAVDDPLHRFDSEGVISKNTASDIVKLAMLRTDEALRRAHLETQMILQVHDELVFEVPTAELAQARAIIKRAMETAFALVVPLVVELGAGENWMAAKP